MEPVHDQHITDADLWPQAVKLPVYLKHLETSLISQKNYTEFI